MPAIAGIQKAPKELKILNSNLYEPAEPNPMTPNPPNERPPNERPPNERPPNERPPNERPGNERPGNECLPHERPPHECPPHERLPNEHPPNENLPYEHHPPAKTQQSAKRARAKRPPTKPNFPNHTPTEAGLFPPRRPTRRGHRVPYTRFGGYILPRDTRPDECTDQAQGKTQDHAATHTPPSSTSCNIYEDETNTAPHTRFGGYLHCPISDLTNAQTRSKAKHGTALPPYPQPSIFCNNETRNKYSATHLPKRVIIQ
ncbi:hypothetical protein BS47DRAFT_1357661 [Hydnum rufescens UP504]|uniref:Uncharacterized protein n=1 Tax=Hydnum rufescens UP504 TaxID=1448309 RepID=A0A9P6B9D0_9AGAM|nr:hypothetical protein BS47DRAFT_1357661 [Hydnum rufescens UP504]